MDPRRRCASWLVLFEEARRPIGRAFRGARCPEKIARVEVHVPGGHRLVKAAVGLVDTRLEDRGEAELHAWLTSIAPLLPVPAHGSVRIDFIAGGVRFGRWSCRVAVDP
ncbi:MAG: hypothetical protein ACOZNI_20930 [Myxococcota bacterium]